jgi:hypothetical protein
MWDRYQQGDSLADIARLDGIMIWQAKTGKVQLKRFTPRLRAAVELARSYKRDH